MAENSNSENDFFDDFNENEPCTSCSKCSRSYDDIDYDYQICSKCGWDAENEKWEKRTEPTEGDYLAGEADPLTGRWY